MRSAVVNSVSRTTGHEALTAQRAPFWTLLALLLLQITIYAETYWSMVQVWWRSETFAHGFLIFPISLYLIWSRREQLREINYRIDFSGLPLIALCGFIWLLAHLADVLVIQQFAVVLMIPAIIWSVCGLQKVWAMAFPLAFLLFAVPTGEFLMDPMMEFTADFTVAAVRLTGIPVFREGLFFTLPTGSWSVVEACSGVRYIIASLTLGCLYAYLTYHSYWRRLIFILLSILAPIIANGIRAYMIVMIGHLSSMKLATGVDHLIYGWIWFGVVMFILFWIGTFWRDDDPDHIDERDGGAVAIGPPKASVLSLSALCATLLLAAWPLWAGYLGQVKTDQLTIATPHSDSWEAVELPITDWKPIYVGSTQTIDQTYQLDDKRVGLFLAHYGNQTQDAELISANNVLVTRETTKWRQVAKSVASVELGNFDLKVLQSKLRLGNNKLLVWRWNIINGTHTIDDQYAKLLEAWSQFAGKGRRGTGVVIYTAYTNNEDEQASQQLYRYLADMLPAIEKSTTNTDP